jgi:DNA-binding MarR family transcriptional regulator
MPSDDELSRLTDKQREVLRLHNEGKNPTEIGKAMGTSSQAVHGHFRRLRAHGLIADEATPSRVAAARRRTTNGFDPGNALAAVIAAAEEGIAKAEQRKRDIDLLVMGLDEERRELDATIEELRKHLPAEEATTT